MIKIGLRLTIITITLALITSCEFKIGYKKGNGNIISKTIDVSDFEALHTNGFFEITLIQGAKEKVVLETDENLFDYIDIYVRKEELQIESLKNIKSKHGVKIYLTYEKLNQIYSNGASVIMTDGTLHAEDLNVRMAGAGKIEMNLEVESVDLGLSGAGLVQLSGKTESQNINLSGAGSLKAFEFKSETCVISLSGVGSAEVYAKETLRANLSGIGGIKYMGDPRHVNKNVTGLGKIKKVKYDNEYDDV